MMMTPGEYCWLASVRFNLRASQNPTVDGSFSGTLEIHSKTDRMAAVDYVVGEVRRQFSADDRIRNLGGIADDYPLIYFLSIEPN